MTEQQQGDLRPGAGRGRMTTTGLGTPSVDAAERPAEQPVERRLAASCRRNPLFWIGGVLSAAFVADGDRAAAVRPRRDPRACDLANSQAAAARRALVRLRPAGLRLPANVVYGARNSLTIGLLSSSASPAARRRHRRDRRLLRRRGRQPAGPDHRHLLRASR